MATSILFSAFESWLVNEHRHVWGWFARRWRSTRFFLEELRIRNTRHDFCQCLFWQFSCGHSLRHYRTASGQHVRIRVSLSLAKLRAPVYSFFLSRAPFDSAILTFIAMFALLVTSWSENYGDANAPISQSFLSAWKSIKSGERCERSLSLEQLICSDRKIFLLGIVQALFEASMYVFVLEWTPALTQALNLSNFDKTDSKNPPIPHGKDPSSSISEQRKSIGLVTFRLYFRKLYGSDDDGLEFI